MKEDDIKKISQTIKDKVINEILRNCLPKYPHKFEIVPLGSKRAEELVREIQSKEDLQRELLNQYLQSAEEVEKSKNPVSAVNLQKLLKPLIELSEIYRSKDLRFRESWSFVDESCINLSAELNMERLKFNSDEYTIGDGLLEKTGRLDTSGKNIFFKHTKGSDWTSISEIYKTWLPSLTRDVIKNDDLLTQILVCYTIKRALNGHEEAVDKLYQLYQDAAIGIAINMAKKRSVLRCSQDAEDMRQEARIILILLISGLSPVAIMKALSSGEDRKIYGLQKWVLNFYVWFYAGYVPRFISTQLDEEIFKTTIAEGYISDIFVLLDPYAMINAKTRCLKADGKRVHRFNSVCFIPTGKTTLTTWLFGTTRNFMQGKFCQLMDETISKYLKRRERKSDSVFARAVAPPDTDTMDMGDDPYPPFMQTGADNDPHDIHQERMETINEALEKKGLSKRDIDIVMEKSRGKSNAEIAQSFGLSKRQIINIVNKAKKN